MAGSATNLVLFDSPVANPTTRDVAALVKSGGLQALPGLVHRADDATYQEVTCRSALNRVEGMPFNWTLNPYRGCTHGCHYCFARRYQSQLELNSGDQFASVILVKKNLVEVLRAELAKPAWKRELVAFGTATDPYQPIEGHYKLTRGALEALHVGRTPIGLVTKGTMVLRDRDVLADLCRGAGCTVYMSVPTVDEDAWRTLEPGTSHPLQRLKAVRALNDAGVEAGVLMAPLVPGFSTQLSKLEATIRTIAEHDVEIFGVNLMFLEGGTRDHFLDFISRQFPSLLDTFERLYKRKYLTKSYATSVRASVSDLRKRYGLIASPRRDRDVEEEEKQPTLQEQTSFSWQS